METIFFITSWSGGKDSAYAFWLACQSSRLPIGLINMMDAQGCRSRSHGLSKKVLQAQANALNLPIVFGQAEWSTYEQEWVDKVSRVIQNNEHLQSSNTQVVFGDIDIESHKIWEENVCAKAGVTAWLPLWQQSRLDLLKQMLDIGLQAVIVSARADCADMLGRILDGEVISILTTRGIDACGENGEYHTCVVWMPNFRSRLELIFGEVLVSPEGYHFLTVDV